MRRTRHVSSAMCLVMLCSMLCVAADTHPKYARVDGEIETVWQRPVKTPIGIVFIAHGCNHQGTDIFSEVGPDGWVFKDCATSNLGKCFGLPEEMRLRRAARNRGYVVMAVSGGRGHQSCWHGKNDVPKVAKAIKHVQDAEGLRASLPVFAIGASSGGDFVGVLAAAQPAVGLETFKLQCIVPQIMPIMTWQLTHGHRGVPTLFVHMPRDERTSKWVGDNIEDLKRQGIRVAEIRVQPKPVTKAFLTPCLEADVAEAVVSALHRSKLLDQAGFLKEDARKRAWVAPVRSAIFGKSTDTLDSDKSCIAELMNVAWAKHEFTSEYAEDMLNFCEAAGHHTLQSGETTRATSFGTLRIKEFGEKGRPVAFILHGAMASEWVLSEWDKVAWKLAEGGYHVILPSLHSSPQTSPGAIGPSRVRALINELVKSGPPALLLGKSWGGCMAARVAEKWSEVERLVLIAPAGCSNLQLSIMCKTALFWAKDDPVAPISHMERFRSMLRRQVLLHIEPVGGHKVLQAYADPISKFAELPTATSEPPVVQDASDCSDVAVEGDSASACSSKSHGLRRSLEGGVPVVLLISGGMAVCFFVRARAFRHKGPNGKPVAGQVLGVAGVLE